MNKLLMMLNFFYLYVYMIDAYGILNNDLYLRMVLIILFITIGLINCIKYTVKIIFFLRCI